MVCPEPARLPIRGEGAYAHRALQAVQQRAAAAGRLLRHHGTEAAEEAGPHPVSAAAPPGLRPARLARILDCLDPSFINVLEFRHPSWWRPEVHDELARRNVVFCGQSHPQLPDAVVATAPVLYYRFHGVPDLYRSPYSEDFLRRVANEIQAQAGIQEVYFNNDIDAAAIGNARRMLALV